MTFTIIFACIKYLTFDEELSFSVNSHKTQNLTFVKFHANDKELDCPM